MNWASFVRPGLEIHHQQSVARDHFSAFHRRRRLRLRCCLLLRPPAPIQSQLISSCRLLILIASTVPNMNSLRGGFLKCMRGISLQSRYSLGTSKVSQSWYSTITFDEFEEKVEIEDADFINDRKELEPQGVDPKKGWGFRGVHKAIVCGKVGQAPVQKILRNGRTVTIFTVGTGGMYDQRIVGGAHLPRPAQWHRIVVHNEYLGAYSVQQLMKDSAVFVEGDIETRVYNDAISGQVKNVPEICVRRDGKVQLIKSGDRASNISLNELRNGLF